jgi:hypothetical protein
MRFYVLILTCSGTSREDTTVERGWWQHNCRERLVATLLQIYFFLNLPVNIILMEMFELGSDFEIFTNI